MEFFNYPPNKTISPFDAIEADNYFAVAGKITYLGTFEEVGNIATPFDKRNDILTGAYVLNIFKRYALVENGNITYLNERFNDGHEIGSSRNKYKSYIIYTNILHKYKIDSWGTHFLESYSIQNTDGTYNCSLQFKEFKNYNLALRHAIEISNNKNMKCIVAQWFADIDRH